MNVNVKISANVTSNALSVLNNTADAFDWADTIPGSLLPQIHAKGQGRFQNVNLGGSTYYVFMNVTNKPFNNQLAREAVVTGLNEDAMNRLSSGTLAPACFFLPPAVAGSPDGSCPYGTPGTRATWPRPRRWSSSRAWQASRSRCGRRPVARASSG